MFSIKKKLTNIFTGIVLTSTVGIATSFVGGNILNDNPNVPDPTLNTKREYNYSIDFELYSCEDSFNYDNIDHFPSVDSCYYYDDPVEGTVLKQNHTFLDTENHVQVVRATDFTHYKHIHLKIAENSSLVFHCSGYPYVYNLATSKYAGPIDMESISNEYYLMGWKGCGNHSLNKFTLNSPSITDWSTSNYYATYKTINSNNVVEDKRQLLTSYTISLKFPAGLHIVDSDAHPVIIGLTKSYWHSFLVGRSYFLA